MNIKLSLDALLVLDVIDRQGSFSAAAEALHRVPSALTYTVQKLEQQLGVAIFDRSGYRAKLTPAGASLLKEGRYLLDAAYRLEQRVSQQASGWEDELHIVLGGLTRMEPLIPIIAEFDQLGASTRLSFRREIFNGVWDALLDERADLVVGAPMHYLHEGCCFLEIGYVDMVLVMAPGHPLAQQPVPLSPEQVRGHRVITVGDTSRNLPRRSIGVLDGQDALLVHSNAAKLKLILAGLGVGYLPRCYVQAQLDAGLLLERVGPMSRQALRSCIAWRQDASGKALQWFTQRLELAIQRGELTV